MAVKYGKFEMPEKISIDESRTSPTFCRFIAEPFEGGFGHTVGNGLRRILLSALEAPAIIGMRLEGVPHEYLAVEGIVEDMTHVVLNLKGALLRYLPSDEEERSRKAKLITHALELTQEILDAGKGTHPVTLKELMGPACPYEIINPDHVIFTATKPFKKQIDVRVGIGRGYLPSESNLSFEKLVDEIVIDACFSPVRLVNYFVENTRVGQNIDYDRLILEVTTDGRISPKEALTFATLIAMQHFQVFEQIKTHELVFDKGEVEANKERDEMMKKLCLKIGEIELSVRSTNCLSSASIETIGELVVMPEMDMLKFRNFGKKSLTEIKQKLDEMGLSLGMDLSKYGINKDNIKAVIQKFMEENAGKEET
jgi:DNA-directed RNA polymerase subunit alpha